MNGTTTLNSFCQGVEQLLSVEAAIRNEPIDETMAKKVAFWKNGMFRIVVMSEIKKGKSSFINALLGVDNLVPVCDDVATSTVYKICYGSKQEYRVFFTRESGRPALTIDAEEVASYGTEAGNPDNEKSVEFIQVSCPSPMLKDGLVIIDTPGLGGIVKGHKRITYNYVPKADAVFLVTESGNSPLGALEMSLVADLKKVTKHIYFVQTKSGTVSEEESRRRRERNIQILTTSAGFRQDEVKYFVVDSVLKRFADEDKDRGILVESGFDKVATFVNQFIRSNVHRLILERAITMVKPRVESLGQILSDREKVFAASTEEERNRLKEEIAAAQNQIEAWERDELPVLQDNFEQGLLDIQHDAGALLDQCLPQGLFYNELIGMVNAAASMDEVKQISANCSEKLPEFFTKVGNEIALKVTDGVTEKVSAFLSHLVSRTETGTELTTVTPNSQFVVANNIGGSLKRFETNGFFEWGRNAVYGGFAGMAIATVVGGAIGSVIPVVGTIIGSELGAALAGLWGATKSVKLANARNLEGAKNALSNSIATWMGTNHRNLSSRFTSLFSNLRLQATSKVRTAIRDARKAMKRDLDTLSQNSKAHLNEISQEYAEFNLLKGRYIKALALMGVMNGNVTKGA